MSFAVLWLGLALVVGILAANRGRSGIGWFLLAACFSSLLAGLLVLVLPSRARGRVAARQDAPVMAHGSAMVAGDGAFATHVAGTAHHQRALERLAGGRTREGAHFACTATLAPEPDNPHDANAVVVIIGGLAVGHLERSAAPAFVTALAASGRAQAQCAALIVGGWQRGNSDRGHFGVRLDAFLPFNLRAAHSAKSARAERALTPFLARAAFAIAVLIALVALLARPQDKIPATDVDVTTATVVREPSSTPTSSTRTTPPVAAPITRPAAVIPGPVPLPRPRP